ncbi:hypothetical protein ACFLWY_02535 [Chloroflexota bacterium]
MSKFIDRLNRVARVAPQAMGFGRVQLAAEKSKILLVAALAEANLDNAADYVDGADAGLLPVVKPDAGARDIQRMSELLSEIPWGGWFKGAKPGEVKAGCDFVVFSPTETPLTMLPAEDIGRVLEVESSVSGDSLVAINGLPVDAVLVASEEGDYSLTWHHLMQFRRFADFVDKPLLVSVPSNVTADELRVLWEVGVDGAVIRVGRGKPVGGLKALCQAVDKLTFPVQRRRGKPEAVIPRLGRDAGIATEEEEDED